MKTVITTILGAAALGLMKKKSGSGADGHIKREYQVIFIEPFETYGEIEYINTALAVHDGLINPEEQNYQNSEIANLIIERLIEKEVAQMNIVFKVIVPQISIRILDSDKYILQYTFNQNQELQLLHMDNDFFIKHAQEWNSDIIYQETEHDFFSLPFVSDVWILYVTHITEKIWRGIQKYLSQDYCVKDCFDNARWGLFHKASVVIDRNVLNPESIRIK